MGTSSFRRRVTSVFFHMRARVSLRIPFRKYAPLGAWTFHAESEPVQSRLPVAGNPRAHRLEVVDAADVRPARRPHAHGRAGAPRRRGVAEDADADAAR